MVSIWFLLLELVGLAPNCANNFGDEKQAMKATEPYHREVLSSLGTRCRLNRLIYRLKKNMESLLWNRICVYQLQTPTHVLGLVGKRFESTTPMSGGGLVRFCAGIVECTVVVSQNNSRPPQMQ
jgi:hypothetical protein